MTDLAINRGKICRPSTDFIYVGNVSHDICDKLTEMWHEHDKINLWKVHGMSGSYICPNEVNPEVKESLDVCIPPGYMHPTVEQYYKELWDVIGEYTNVFPFAEFSSFSIKDDMQIQWYPKGGGFKVWHCERSNSHLSQIARHLVFMTYLNDVPNGGTEWFHQEKYVDAVKGATVIWPADWCFTHRGRVTQEHEKMIITGWLQYD
tara:strand:- start:2563 stop:3177 length:615 start_codon:yes stop_codon:yes gene_type:complete